MTQRLMRLLAIEDGLERLGMHVAADRVRGAIIQTAFEDKMEREGMGGLL